MCELPGVEMSFVWMLHHSSESLREVTVVPTQKTLLKMTSHGIQIKLEACTISIYEVFILNIRTFVK